MTICRTTALLLTATVCSSLPARPQQSQPAASAAQTTAPTQPSKPKAVHANQDNRQILVKSGTLSLLSTREADLLTGDADGHPVTLTFACDRDTKEDTASTGDAVNILYVANGPSNLALVIHLIRTPAGTKGSNGEIGGVAKSEPTKRSPGEIGGIASIESLPLAYSLSSSDTEFLQKKLEGDFGLTVTSGDTKPAYGRFVVLKNHELIASRSSDITPWNIYVNGDMHTDLYMPLEANAAASSYSSHSALGQSALGQSALGAFHHKVSPAEGQEYVFIPGDTLKVINVTVKPNSVLLELAAEHPVHLLSSGIPSAYTSTERVYSTLAFPITADDTPTAYTVEQQIAQLLNPKPDSLAAASAAVAAAPAAAPAVAATTPFGLTHKQVTDALGKPQEILTQGEREIYIYDGLKVIFINGRVTEVQ